MRSLLDLLVASLTAIHASRSHVHRRPPLDLTNRSIETVEANTYGLPEGESIAEELRRWFKRQRRVVLKAIPMRGMLPIHLPRLQDREWVDPMAAAMAPLLAPYWIDAYNESRSRLSRARAVMDLVVNPHLRRQIESQSFNFCRSTNESTSRRLEDALDALKLEFVQGLVEQGEAGPELARRVKAIFEGLTERHAATIAATEASRAIHAAQELAALESGVVAGKELLISADACELCQMVATEAKQVRLGQAFAVIGNHPEYSTIMHPPLHPNCRCSMIDILLPEYGGPVNAEWGLTLFQPQQELEGGYEPPRGLTVPEPEPERLQEKPVPEKKPPIEPLPPRQVPMLEEIERAIGVKFVPSPGAKKRGYQTVIVSIPDLDPVLAQDTSFHVGPGGVGPSAKPGAYERFKEFLFKAKIEGIPIEMPRLAMTKAGEPFIDDGRHRWAVFRDMGVKYLPISVPRRNAKAFRKRFGEEKPKELVRLIPNPFQVHVKESLNLSFTPPTESKTKLYSIAPDYS